jgi:hypothetical protein
LQIHFFCAKASGPIIYWLEIYIYFYVVVSREFMPKPVPRTIFLFRKSESLVPEKSTTLENFSLSCHKAIWELADYLISLCIKDFVR